MTATPGFGTTGMAPAQPVTVTVAQGVIDTLTMTAADGTPVTGAISPDRSSWTLAQKLVFGERVHGHRDRDRHRPTAGPDHRHLRHRRPGYRGAGHRVPG